MAVSEVKSGRVTLDDVVESRAREIAREEITSLCGLVLRRLQDRPRLLLPVNTTTTPTSIEALSAIFGEALADFSGHTEGEEPGAESA